MISYYCQPGEIYSIPKVYFTNGKWVITKGKVYKTMSKYHKRCSVCDLSTNAAMNYNHPMFLAAPSEASYQQSLHATTFFKEMDSGDTVCSHCLSVQVETADTFDFIDELLLDGDFDDV